MKKKYKNTADATDRLKCQKNTNDQYSLYYKGIDGKYEAVPHIGTSLQPFEIVHDSRNRNLAILKKHYQSPEGVKKRLYLINYKTGQISHKKSNGVPKIIYDVQNDEFHIPQTTRTPTDQDYIDLLYYLLSHGITLDDMNLTRTQITHLQQITTETKGIAIELLPKQCLTAAKQRGFQHIDRMQGTLEQKYNINRGKKPPKLSSRASRHKKEKHQYTFQQQINILENIDRAFADRQK